MTWMRRKVRDVRSRAWWKASYATTEVPLQVWSFEDDINGDGMDTGGSLP